MGNPQTKILAFGQPGAQAGEATKIVDESSAINAEASANLQPGVIVKPGTNVKEAKLFTAGAAMLGLARIDRVHAPGSFGSIDQAGSPPGYVPGTHLPVLTEGRGWVIVDSDAAVTPNVTRGFVRAVANGAGKSTIGACRHDSDGGNSDDHQGQIVFVSGIIDANDILTGGTTKIAEIEISRSNKA